MLLVFAHVDRMFDTICVLMRFTPKIDDATFFLLFNLGPNLIVYENL